MNIPANIIQGAGGLHPYFLNTPKKGFQFHGLI